MENIKKYVIVDYPEKGKNSGIFKSKSPKRAASKAFSQLVKHVSMNNGNGKFIVFTIQNTKTKKEYKYIGSRIKLARPKEILKNGKKITYRYENIVGKYKKELNQLM